MDKELWKDVVTSSLQGMKRAEPNPFLFTRIEERIKSSTELLPNTIVSFPKLSMAFAGVTLLFALNFFVVKNSIKSHSMNNNTSQRAYSLNNVDYQLY